MQECVAYLRVSTERQAEEGNGLESQKRDIQAYAKKNNLIITDWYTDDGYTGSNMDRPQLQRLIGDCSKRRVKCVVAFKLDRLSRSMVDGIYMIERVFQKNGVDFRCVHDNVGYDDPMQQAYTQMMAVFAQLDKNTMLLRMRGGMIERVKQGYWPGGGNLPYCYSYNKEKGILVPIPERAEQARKALQLFNAGFSDDKIRKILGYKQERTVSQILTGIVNIGMIPYKGQVYKGLHEPIFDKEEFNAALENRKVRRECRTYSRTEPNLLTGLCYCGVCGCKMRYQKWTNGQHKIYCCSRNSNLNRLPNWNHDCYNSLHWACDIEDIVEKKLLEISVNLLRDSKIETGKYSKIIQENIDKEKKKIKRLYDLFADGNDTVLELIKEKEKYIHALKEELEKELKKESPQREIIYEKIKTLADIWDNIDKQDIHEKNRILKSIISKIVIVNENVEIILRDF